MAEKNNTKIDSTGEGQQKADTVEEKTSKKGKGVLKKTLSVILAVVIVCISFAGGYFSNYLFNSKNSLLARDLVSIMEKVGYIYDPLTGQTREITDEEIGDALVNAILDQYSAYYTDEEYKTITQNANGNYGGVGIGFYDDDLSVDIVYMNSPADRAGLKAGDVFVRAFKNGQDVTNFLDIDNVMQFVSGLGADEYGYFTVMRGSEEIEVSFKKENYQRSYVYYSDDQMQYKFFTVGGKLKGVESSVESSNITASDVGYIFLDNFAGDAGEQMEQALNYMESRGKTKLILDLRENGGGYMDVLTTIASYFIYNGGKTRSSVAFSQSKTGMEEYKTDKNRFQNFIDKMVILANENTASASECLIGAVVNYGDLVDGISSVIVEKNSFGVAKTYGKGIMQTTYLLVSGGAFKLTTAKVLWPDKTTCIHGVGVTQSMGCTVAENGFAIDAALAALN